MSDPFSATMHWVSAPKTKSQIRAEDESAGRLAAAWSSQLRRVRALLSRPFSR
jgi:hypothetical protein